VSRQAHQFSTDACTNAMAEESAVSVRHHKGGPKAALVISPILQCSPFASTALRFKLDRHSKIMDFLRPTN
jgi:hypothetical protein